MSEDVAMEGFDAPAGAATARPTGKKKYHKSYYTRHKDDLADKAHARWETNRRGYRDKGLQRARDKRAQVRTSKADEVFQERVANITSSHGKCDKCGRKSARPEVRPCNRMRRRKRTKKATRVPRRRCTGTIQRVDEPLKTKPPRLVELHGEATHVYSSGVLALLCGKSPATVRTWIEERVLPGYSIKVSGRYWFTADFIEACVEAVRKVLFMDGRGKLAILRRYVRQELETRSIRYTPFTPKC